MKNQPYKVSLLIPARNEEKVLGRLLDSIERLKYPKDDLEVLLASDGSSDDTLAIMQDFAKNKPWVKVYDIPDKKQDETLNGKARVLAILAKEAKGDWLFLTDADIELPNTWISGMLTELENTIENRKSIATKEIGVLVGVSGIRTTSVMAAMQALEMFLMITLNKEMSDQGKPTTGMGHNMAILKKAYLECGGHEKMGFSIVEDYTLYKMIIGAGYDFRQVFMPEVLAYTLPADKFFEQRKRFIMGAFEGRSGPMVMGLIQGLSLPAYIAIAFYNWMIALGIFLSVFGLYVIKTLKFEKTLKINGYLKYLPIFAFYMPIGWFFQFIHYFLPGKVVWKGRKY
ncbi:glycosyltransferase [Lacihabitans sp. LS3-19]|uniref:glycosyltransferase n=1 Tax=Lacihabitans sp. LS3-19 TaxID=2487335 RepID=UPI0020CC5684|nr:glycosyltransferase [Lacihabitans sp. LS3-19]MCP9767755.1 glycosyltransferase [Lacihabitans sp. LS3-19]